VGTTAVDLRLLRYWQRDTVRRPVSGATNVGCNWGGGGGGGFFILL